MGKITFSQTELIKILISNAILPKVILRPKVEGEEIHFVVNANLPFLQFVPLSLRYLNYADDNAIFEVNVVNSSLNKMISRLNLLSKLDVPTYIKIDFPKIYINVNQLLKEKNINGVLLKEILFNNGEFTIVTCNPETSSLNCKKITSTPESFV
jgi:hypothetical protein